MVAGWLMGLIPRWKWELSVLTLSGSDRIAPTSLMALGQSASLAVGAIRFGHPNLGTHSSAGPGNSALSLADAGWLAGLAILAGKLAGWLGKNCPAAMPDLKGSLSPGQASRPLGIGCPSAGMLKRLAGLAGPAGWLAGLAG